VTEDAATIPSPRPASPLRAATRDVTRYLCAAAYLDADYARLLIRQIAAEPYLAVAPAPECDIPVVLRHAYAALIRRHRRDLLLSVLLLLALIFLIGVRSLPLVALTLFAAWVTVLVFHYTTYFGQHLQQLRPESFDPAAAPKPPTREIGTRIAEIGSYATGNVTVYSGYGPFVGYGVALDSWSFALDVNKADPNGTTPLIGFDVTEIYAYVASRLRTLALPDLVIGERLFVDGAAIIDDERFLADPVGRPVASVSTALIDALKREPEDRARPYLTVQSTGWRGELVSSLFLRFSRSESNLFIEADHTVLCPLRPEYKVIDLLMRQPTGRDHRTLLRRASRETIADLFASPVRAVRGFDLDLGMQGRIDRQLRQIAELNRFDYGARFSVRQLASDTQYHRYFQKQDSGMVVKVVEKRVLDALVEFAQDHGIDVTDLLQRQETIINNGIIAGTGAQVTASAVASGGGSRAWIRSRVTAGGGGGND
jgi:hypothetical protein